MYIYYIYVMYVYMVNLYKLSYTCFYSQIRINNKNL